MEMSGLACENNYPQNDKAELGQSDVQPGRKSALGQVFSKRKTNTLPVYMPLRTRP